MRPDAKGRLKIFTKPNPSLRYAIGGDISEGLEIGDASSAFVIDSDYSQCAVWYGKSDPDLFGEILCRLGEYYNEAVLAPEVNNHGHATMAAIKRKGYGNLFIREVKEERSDVFTKKLGWLTTAKTKHLMLDEFVRLYREGSLTIKDVELAKEMMGLVIESDGNVILNGKDRFVAGCIACQAIKQASATFKAVVPTKTKTNFKTLEEKLEYFNKRRRNDSYYD